MADRFEHAVLRWGRPIQRRMLIEARSLLAGRRPIDGVLSPIDGLVPRDAPPSTRMDATQETDGSVGWFFEEHQFILER